VCQLEKAIELQRHIRSDGDLPMLDVLMMFFALALFAVSVGYAYGCDRL